MNIKTRVMSIVDVIFTLDNLDKELDLNIKIDSI